MPLIYCSEPTPGRLARCANVGSLTALATTRAGEGDALIESLREAIVAAHDESATHDDSKPLPDARVALFHRPAEEGLTREHGEARGSLHALRLMSE